MAANGAGSFFPTNPDLADILGRTDFDFENFYFLDFFGSQISGLGPAWAHLGPPTWAPRVGRGAPRVGPSGGPSGGPKQQKLVYVQTIGVMS